MRKIGILIAVLCAVILTICVVFLAIRLQNHLDNRSYEKNVQTDVTVKSPEPTSPDASLAVRIKTCADEFGVPEALVYAVIECESNFNEKAVSKAGAIGLMQLTKETFSDIRRWMKEDFKDEEIYDPYVNLRAGTYYLSYLYKKFGDWELVMAAYNAGPGAVQKWLKDERYAKDGKLYDIPYAETRNYVKKVSTAWEKYKIALK